MQRKMSKNKNDQNYATLFTRVWGLGKRLARETMHQLLRRGLQHVTYTQIYTMAQCNPLTKIKPAVSLEAAAKESDDRHLSTLAWASFQVSEQNAALLASYNALHLHTTLAWLVTPRHLGDT